MFGNALTSGITATGTNGNSGCNDNGAAFRVSGSQAVDRQAGDLLADYFGLPLDYQSTVYVKPEIQNFLVDFDFFIGLDQWLCGFWFRIHAPVVYAKWKLRMDEAQAQPGTVYYPAGYFAPAAVPVAHLNSSFVSYLQGNVPTLNGGVTFQPLQNGKICGRTTNTVDGSISCNSEAHTIQLSDIRFSFGWNFWQDEDYHIGLGGLAAAPTGSRVNDTLLFQPFVGNGHHWELGGKFTSHYTLWRNCDLNRSVGFYFDADATLLFATRQFRVFDLCGAGDNSKYMLAQVMNIPATDDLSGNGISTTGAAPYIAPVGETPTPSVYQFSNVFVPAANITAQNIKVSQDIQIDFTAMLNYTHCSLAWDIGYNFWVTGCERINQCGNTTALLQGNATYALKGDASVYGFDNGNATGGLYDPIALGATESMATICSGTNIPLGSTVTAATSVNANIDLPQYAYGNATGAVPPYDALFNVTTGGVPATNQTNTSIQSLFLGEPNVDVQGCRGHGISNKIFTHVSYTWENCGCYTPYLGAGGKAEFALHKKECGASPCANSSGCTVATNAGNNFSCFSSCGDNGCRRQQYLRVGYLAQRRLLIQLIIMSASIIA